VISGLINRAHLIPTKMILLPRLPLKEKDLEVDAIPIIITSVLV
jgi:hypothetical protein